MNSVMGGSSGGEWKGDYRVCVPVIVEPGSFLLITAGHPSAHAYSVTQNFWMHWLLTHPSRRCLSASSVPLSFAIITFLSRAGALAVREAGANEGLGLSLS